MIATIEQLRAHLAENPRREWEQVDARLLVKLLDDADLAAQLAEQLETLRTHPRVDDLLRVTEELRVAREIITDPPSTAKEPK